MTMSSKGLWVWTFDVRPDLGPNVLKRLSADDNVK